MLGTLLVPWGAARDVIDALWGQPRAAPHSSRCPALIHLAPGGRMMALVSPDWFDRWGGFGVEEPAHLQDTSHAGVSVLAQQAQCIQWAGARGGGASGWAGPWWHCHPWQSRAIVVSEEEMKPWKNPIWMLGSSHRAKEGPGLGGGSQGSPRFNHHCHWYHCTVHGSCCSTTERGWHQ